jgi:hypothetical protein
MVSTAAVFYDTLILRLPLNGNLQKQGSAGRSECANLGAGGRRFKSGRPDQQHDSLLGRVPRALSTTPLLRGTQKRPSRTPLNRLAGHTPGLGRPLPVAVELL